MFNFFNKKHKYLNCPYLKHSLHFFYDDIRACCTNVKGPIFFSEFKNITLENVYNMRKNIIKSINKEYKDGFPPECKGCFELNNYMQDKPVDNFENKIDRIYFHNNMTCNAKCIYCTYSQMQRGHLYEALPFVKEIINSGVLSKNALVYMSGGEITIAPEFEELLSTLINYLDSKVEILTSGIKYCKSIEEGFIQNKMRLVISLDSACRETYLKLKQVDCFDKLVENLKKYISASDNAKENITLKYIIVDDINDNLDEINNFIKLVKELGIKNIRLDFDYEKYKYTGDLKVPNHYYDLYEAFNKNALQSGLEIQKCEQVEAILNKK